jgi:hypothetical protein
MHFIVSFHCSVEPGDVYVAITVANASGQMKPCGWRNVSQ